MKIKIITLFAIAVMLLFIGGCIKTVDTTTGEENIGLDPKVDKKITEVGDTLEVTIPPIAATAAALHPAVGAVITGVGAILIGIYGTYKKMRPQLLAATDRYDKAVLGLRAAAGVIETAVKPNKELWEGKEGEGGLKDLMIKAEIKGAINPDTV